MLTKKRIINVFIKYFIAFSFTNSTRAPIRDQEIWFSVKLMKASIIIFSTNNYDVSESYHDSTKIFTKFFTNIVIIVKFNPVNGNA